MPTVHTITYSFKSRAGRVYRNVVYTGNLLLMCNTELAGSTGTSFILGIYCSCLKFIP